MKRACLILIVCVLIPSMFVSSNLSLASAQQGEITIPDLTGMALPQAAKVVGDVGLLYQGETMKAWTADAKVKVNQISDQQPAPGQKAAVGAPVSVTVLRAFNISLTYDGTSITLKNTSNNDVDLSSVTFTSGQGKDLSQFSAFEWGIVTLKPGECDRILAGFKATPAAVDCQKVVRQNVYTEKTKQFWIKDTFNVMRMGEGVTSCDGKAGRCDFYLPQADDTERTTYLNFNYRTNHLVVRNDSERWMILSNIYVAGRDLKRFTLDTLDNFTAGDIPWAGHRLAPGQCVVYSELSIGDLPPYDCKVVGYIRIPKGTAFWTKGFTMVNLANGQQATCAAPVPGTLSVCLVPRELPVK